LETLSFIMKDFLSCDWGTSSFRIRLVDVENSKVLSEEKSNQGIAATFNLWHESGDLNEQRKVSFYLNIIQQHIKKIEEKINYPLSGVKVIISGMASSSIGFIDIPYSSVPLSVDGSGIQTAFIAATNDFEHDVLIISGVKTDNDVMRGEETQLIGCVDPSVLIKNELYIFPGTHSKHILIKNNRLLDFKTYMTGELFELLSQKSILKSAVQIDQELESVIDLSSFIKGVKEAMSSNILSAIFKVRTNQLFNLITNLENFNYLSGLLIGTELKDLKMLNVDAINLVCGSNLGVYYDTALKEIGIRNINLFPPEWVDEATVRGHYKIGKQLKILT
jgi:2-dehydro-3-deoxygalactonokinase